MSCPKGKCSGSGKLFFEGTSETVVCLCAYGGRPPARYTQADLDRQIGELRQSLRAQILAELAPAPPAEEKP